MNLRTHLTTAVAALALAGAACGGGGSNAPATGSAQGSAPAASGAKSASTAEYGVPECDDYVKAYLACVESKVPAEVRTTLRQSFDQSREAWKRAAATDDGRKGLAMACTQARSAARRTMQPYGCTF